VRDGRALIAEKGLQDTAQFVQADAFDRISLATVTPRPTLAVVSGLYELFPDNEMVQRSLAGVGDAVEDRGYLVYTGQPWHPQLEMIARALTSHRQGEAWVMRRRTQVEMDQLVEEAGFRKIDQRGRRVGDLHGVAGGAHRAMSAAPGLPQASARRSAQQGFPMTAWLGQRPWKRAAAWLVSWGRCSTRPTASPTGGPPRARTSRRWPSTGSGRSRSGRGRSFRTGRSTCSTRCRCSSRAANTRWTGMRCGWLPRRSIACTCFIAWPLHFSFGQPAVDGAPAFLFNALRGFDQPFNQAPSLHIALAVILWDWYRQFIRPLWARLVLHVWAFAICASVLTTWQHHFIDIPTGALLGVLCVWLWPLERVVSMRRALGRSRALRSGGSSRGSMRWVRRCFSHVALYGGGVWLWLAWPAASLAFVALNYIGLGARGFQMNGRGRMGWAARWLFAPYRLGAAINAWLWTRKLPASVEVVPGLRLGRRPTHAEWLAAGKPRLVSLCAELQMPAGVPHARCVPLARPHGAADGSSAARGRGHRRPAPQRGRHAGVGLLRARLFAQCRSGDRLAGPLRFGRRNGAGRRRGAPCAAADRAAPRVAGCRSRR
jgi:hypothetical protein